MCDCRTDNRPSPNCRIYSNAFKGSRDGANGVPANYSRAKVCHKSHHSEIAQCMQQNTTFCKLTHVVCVCTLHAVFQQGQVCLDAVHSMLHQYINDPTISVRFASLQASTPDCMICFPLRHATRCTLHMSPSAMYVDTVTQCNHMLF